MYVTVQTRETSLCVEEELDLNLRMGETEEAVDRAGPRTGSSDGPVWICHFAMHKIAVEMMFTREIEALYHARPSNLWLGSVNAGILV